MSILRSRETGFAIRSYQYARSAGDKAIMDDAISLSVEFMPQSPETQLYAANHQFELKEFQRAVASYKLAVYYAGGLKI